MPTTTSRGSPTGRPGSAVAVTAAAWRTVDVDEVHTYQLATAESAHDGTQGCRRTTFTADDLADVFRMDSNLEHPATAEVEILDDDVVRFRHDAAHQVLERLGQHVRPARPHRRCSRRFPQAARAPRQGPRAQEQPWPSCLL